MFVCIRTSDGKYCGGQTAAPQPGALTAQAIVDYGGASTDYEEKEVTEEEFLALVGPSTLEEKRAEKLEQASVEKTRALDAGVEVDGILYDTDAMARLAYLELESDFANDPTYTTGWKASNGTWVTMDLALYTQIRSEGKAKITAIFAWLAAKQAEIAAATSETIDSISTEYS